MKKNNSNYFYLFVFTKQLNKQSNRKRFLPVPCYLLLVTCYLSLLLLSACGDAPSPTAPPKEQSRERVLFLSNRDGWPDLYTSDQSGKNLQRLTESAAAEYGSVWSPDGKKIAFTEVEGDQANGDYNRSRRIATIDNDGKNHKLIASDGFNPQWSPDGTRLLFMRALPIGLATATPTAIPTEANPNGLAPTPQPANTSTARFKGGLYLAPADGSAGVKGGTPVALVADNAVEGRWSPDGKKIAYVAGNNDLNQKRSLWLTNPDGSDRVSISDKAKLGDLDILHVAWSPDGVSLAFTATDTTRDKVSLYRLPIEGTQARRLTDYNGSARDLTGLIWAYADYFNPASRLYVGPVWSPNSRRIAYADGSATITVVEAENANRQTFPVGSATLGQDKDSVLNVTWLADSRRLIYDRAAAGRNDLLAQANLYIYDFFDETLEMLDTINKNTTPLAGPGNSFFTPVCCGLETTPNLTPTPAGTALSSKNQAEGKLVYVSGLGQRQLIVNDLKTQERTVISSGLFKVLDFTLSPRSDRMVYLEVGDKYNATLYLSSLDGKQKRKLSEGTGEPDDLSNVVAWSPDGRQIAFQVLKGDANLKPGLYVLNTDVPDSTSAAPRLVTQALPTSVVWSPDSRQLAYKLDNVNYELWLAPVDTHPINPRLVAQLGQVNPNYASLGKGLAWSPNGQTIALTGLAGYSRFLVWLVSPANGQIREVPTSGVIARVVGWTNDSNNLMVVVASYSQNTDIQAYSLSRSLWRQYGIGGGPQLSPDGTYAAYYARYDNRTAAPGGSDLAGRLLSLQLVNGELRSLPLDYTPYYGFKPRFYSWSPDGKMLAYYSNNTIYAASPNGQAAQILARAFLVDKLGWTKG